MKRHPKRGRRSTPISTQKPAKGKIEAPGKRFLEQPRVKAISWYLDAMPDYLWLAILLQPDLREVTFAKLPALFASLGQQKGPPYISLTMQGLAEADEATFTAIVAPFLQNPTLKLGLAALGIVPRLPGEERWRRVLPEPAEDAEFILLMGCAAAAAQDGRAATDIAYVNYVSQIVQGQLHINLSAEERAAINRYPLNPNDGVLDGRLRAHRNATATMGALDGPQRSAWVEAFYLWGRTDTSCGGFAQDDPDPTDFKDHVERTLKIVSAIESSCHEALIDDFQTSGLNDLREVMAGICLYAADLARFAIGASSASPSTGMILLRTLAELNILGSHLLKDHQEARRYRSYGAGRAKLLVNKIEELGEGASVFDLVGFSHVANERRDEMYVDMPIGSFYSPSIRDVALKSGTKDIYDKYYDISSTYCHGEWAAIGSLSVQQCLNPLHLGHYVPSERRFPVELMADLIWLIDRLQGLLGAAREASKASPPAEYER